jgi:hexokinase
MGLILIFAAIIVVAIVTIIITHNADVAGASLFITVIFGTGLFIALCVLADKKTDTKYDIAKYENLKEQLVSMENGECDVPSDVLECVLDVNNMIEDHKAHVDSWFTGVYHSKEVAALEHLKLPMTNNEPKEE